ncbi:hypothetical protein VNO80_12307 [Phaseolus coccineus]|uniref:Uncharacterized protein n=1 Tax=Phaseolus coccineus TaxID=3886 RepID=A0AAN9R6A7_PHACN
MYETDKRKENGRIVRSQRLCRGDKRRERKFQGRNSEQRNCYLVQFVVCHIATLLQGLMNDDNRCSVEKNINNIDC